MFDPFGRKITYLRVSVTDRCDFRCVYCMPEHMTFLPRAELLTLEELERLCSAFIRKGVERLRITGGEPLVRRDVMQLFEGLGDKIGHGLSELTLTTNGSQLARFAAPLYATGVRRVNVSLDTRDPDRFRAITRGADLKKVLAGIDAAQSAGLSVKINMVALKNGNEDEIDGMLRWAHSRGMDLTLIETMPLGDVDAERVEQYLPLSLVRTRLARDYTLQDEGFRTGGPARYVRVAETGGAARLHHAAYAQFLRKLQSGARHLYRHALYVSGPGGCGGFAASASPLRFRRPAHGGDPRRHKAQAQRP
jgi:cyclic pyranopterin phosphate synthase